jgi:sulfite exporter TauE/SafE
MLAFGAGTLPTLLAMGALAARVAEAMQLAWVRRVAGLAIVMFGVLHVAGAGAQIADRSSHAHACCADHQRAPR